MYPELQQVINSSRHIVFFGGAGVSTDSALPPILLLHGEQDGVGHGGAAFWRGDALAQMAAFVLNGGFPLRPGN